MCSPGGIRYRVSHGVAHYGDVSVDAMDVSCWFLVIRDASAQGVGNVRTDGQNGTWVARRPDPGPRPETIRQNSMASRSRSRPPPAAGRPVPPAGPREGEAVRLPWRPAHSVTTSATIAPSWSESVPSGARGPASVDPVHPGVAGEDRVDEEADGPLFRPHRSRVAGGDRPTADEPRARLRPLSGLRPDRAVSRTTSSPRAVEGRTFRPGAR